MSDTYYIYTPITRGACVPLVGSSTWGQVTIKETTRGKRCLVCGEEFLKREIRLHYVWERLAWSGYLGGYWSEKHASSSMYVHECCYQRMNKSGSLHIPKEPQQMKLTHRWKKATDMFEHEQQGLDGDGI